MANNNQTYAEQVAAFRAQRRQQELTADYNQATRGGATQPAGDRAPVGDSIR